VPKRSFIFSKWAFREPIKGALVEISNRAKKINNNIFFPKQRH
jgi:hypothetical protein